MKLGTSIVLLETQYLFCITGFQSVVRQLPVVREFHSGGSRGKWDYKEIEKQN
jgi:hypothetical protein